MAPAVTTAKASGEAAGDGLKKLEYLSLVSKVCTELESHIGCGDKVLAEFITELGQSSTTVDEFDAKLKDNGAEMPDYFVRTLLTIIHAILPPSKSQDRAKDKSDPKKPSAFPGLSRPDELERAKQLRLEIEREATERKADSEHDDRDNRGRVRDRDQDRHRRGGDKDRDRGRRSDRDRDRDWDRDRDRDERDRDAGRDRDRRREDDRHRDSRAYEERDDRSRDSRKERDDSRHRDSRAYDHEHDDDDEERRDGKGSSQRNSDEPELYKVCKGRVSRVMDTGCFVQLNELRGKEGLVHISQISNKRVTSAKDVVKRDQEVYVKVISVSGQKLSLSMRDVDQDTGQDLLPMKKNSEGEILRANPVGANGGPTKRIGLSGITIVEEEEHGSSRRPVKRMSSPEKWEAKQLIAAGVMDLSDYPMFDEDGDGMLYQEEGAEEELEIELNEDEPSFLQGQSQFSIDMSPVKIFKNPDGSLSRAAAL